MSEWNKYHHKTYNKGYKDGFKKGYKEAIAHVAIDKIKLLSYLNEKFEQSVLIEKEFKNRVAEGEANAYLLMIDAIQCGEFAELSEEELIDIE